MKTSRVELSFEQHEIWRISRADIKDSVRCPYCSETSQMIAAESVARITRSSLREIYKRIDDGSLHFVETSDRQVLICSSSFSEMNLDKE